MSFSSSGTANPFFGFLSVRHSVEGQRDTVWKHSVEGQHDPARVAAGLSFHILLLIVSFKQTCLHWTFLSLDVVVACYVSIMVVVARSFV